MVWYACGVVSLRCVCGVVSLVCVWCGMPEVCGKPEVCVWCA